MIKTLTLEIDLDTTKLHGSTLNLTNQLSSFLESEAKRFCIVSGAKVINVNNKLNVKTKTS
jgi:hypothetical protein